MSDTPRTDEKAQFFGFNPDEGEEFVTASFCRELERENTALREQVEHLIGMIEQLEVDLAHFATIEAFEGKKEAQP